MDTLRMRWGAQRNLSLAGTVVVCAALLLAACSSAPSKPAADPLATAIARQLNSRTTEEQVRAVIVDVDGHRRFERYYSSSASTSRSAFSVTKSVMSTLIGIAVGEGRLRLDQRLDQLLPDYAAVMKPSVARVTLRQLLTMTAGFGEIGHADADAELERAPNWTRFILTHQDTAPGSAFQYSNYGAHLLSPILVQATGQSVLAYARRKLFDPLGIPTRPGIQPRYAPSQLAKYQRAKFAWPVDPQGFNTGAHSIKLRPRDLATLGELWRHHGRWHDRQLVPASWLASATVAQAGQAFVAPRIGAFDPDNYGYFFWVETAGGHAAYYALGAGGQLIEVVPQLRPVIAVSSDVNLTDEDAPTVGADDLQDLVDTIVSVVGRK